MPKSKSRKKRPPKRVLALPDLEHAKTAVLNSLTSASGQRTYDHAIREFVAWYCSEPRLAFNRTVVLRYRIHLEQRGYAPATINLRLAAVRRIAYEAADAGLLSPELAAGIRRVKGVRRIGVRLGNWLTPEQGRRLLEAHDAVEPARAAGPRDGRDADRLRPAPRRVAGPAPRVNSATRGALGHCRSRRQGRTRPHRAHPHVGEERRRRVDRRGGHHARPGVPRDQQGRARLGRRHVARRCSGMWCAPPRLAPASTSWRRTTCDAPAPVSATWRAANWIRSSSCSVTCRSRRRSATSDASRSSGLP